MAGTRLSAKERARVARAAPKDRESVRYCLARQHKGKKTGTIAGGAGGAGVAILTGGGVLTTAIAAGGGAIAGRLIGKASATDKRCHAVLRRNR